MKKRILVCILLTVCLLFAGCRDKDNDLTGLGHVAGLDSKIELQIIKSYFGKQYKGQESVDEKIIEDYYGTYNGYSVIRILEDPENSDGMEAVSGIEFKYYRAGRIRAWKSGKFYYLQDAINKGYLNQEQIEEISEKNKRIYLFEYEYKEIDWLGQIEGLDPETELQILRSYYGKQYKRYSYPISTNPIKYYYGTYNGCIVIRWPQGWSMGKRVIIKECEFIFPPDSQIVTWKDGEFIYFGNFYVIPDDVIYWNTALDDNLLSKEDVEKINTIDRNIYADAYENR